ncbi:squalene--hopene cyclase [Metabacillus iocasae]|uniref:Sporulenol synthase n=1 Tax=Priestia iocasae TaxID=2291674 RepID=A0ABS2QVD3_9BACI|nr:squalene--hopene cyclase [Metabacillus iocasae]MBM7703446.1 sporulenol synthase [Metabacillus iocasae]
MENEIKANLLKRIDALRTHQHSDGSWRFMFEGSVMTDAFMIMTLRALDIENEALIKQLVERILYMQTADGVWKLYEDEKAGNLSATVQAYTALLFSGHVKRDDRLLRKAERFILHHGGLEKTHFMTKWMLAVHGLYPWPRFFYVPLSLLLLPTYTPLNFYELSTYARIHFAPMMIAANKKMSIKSKSTPDIRHLFSSPNRDLHDTWYDEYRSVSSFLTNELKKLATFPSYIQGLGYREAERYILERIEKDGTLNSYASATFFMIYALLALNYQKNSPVIQSAISGLESLVTKTNEFYHLENSTSTVWDTALLSYALQEAGVSSDDEMIQKSLRYLLKKQHTKRGDWHIHNPGVSPGGWGFSHINTINPDLDDTSAALRALSRKAAIDESVRAAWQRGTTWLLSMQNQSGGFAAFEKNTDNPLFTYIPLENAQDAATDPPTPDLTGRVLEYVGKYAGMKQHHPSIQAAVKWLLSQQHRNGSWYGRWGVCYIYGTWAAVTGLRAVGVERSHPQLAKAVQWLKQIQHEDGGWGESCESAAVKTYKPLTFSTPSQTAWALDALISVCRKEDEVITRGMKFLLKAHDLPKRQLHYPTGIGLPGQYYIYYHSYNDIFPMLTFAHYLHKKKTESNRT